MPSLQALRDFKTSFHSIGGEISARAEENMPFEDLELPDYEPLVQTEAPGIPEAPPGEGPDLSGETGEPDFSFDDLNDPALKLDEIPGGDAFSGGETPAGEIPEADDADFLALLDTIPDDLGQSPEAPAETAESAESGAAPENFLEDAGDLSAGFGDPETEASAESPPEPEPGADDFGLPQGLLDGLGDDLAEAAGDATAAGDVISSGDFGETGDLPAEFEDLGGEFSPEDLGGEPAFEDLGLESPAETPAKGAGLEDFSIPDMDLGGEEFTEDLGGELAAGDLGGEELTEDLGGEPAFEDLGGEFSPEDLGGEPAFEDLGGEFSPEDLGLESPAETPAKGAGMEDFSIPDMDLGGEELTEDLGGELAAGDLGGEELTEDLGGELAAGDLGGEEFIEDLGGELTEEDFGGDSFDTFNLDGDSPGSGGTDEAAGGNDLEGLDDFALPGIDDVFAGGIPGSRGRSGMAGSAGGMAQDEVEEIQLNENELALFQKTLAGYPLNLRIACEELIAEQAVAPDLMSRLVKLLIQGAPAREAASLAGKILGRTIPIPRGFEKNTGEALEAEQASFAYIFVHKFLPVLRIFLLAAIGAASLFFLIFQFIYTPLRAEKLYKMGYERLFAGEYQRANDRFSQAFGIHRNKNWFYRYAEAFRDERQYLYAEQKYDELLNVYPRDKKGVLDYAALESEYQRNYARTDELLRRNLLDYAPNDREALLALGDNSLAWGELDASKYEDARFAYARLLDKYGWIDPVVERMMLYFIRTDNLKEVLPLQAYFMGNKRRKISAPSLAELGGYLLDKRLEEVRGVPNEYVEQIEGIRELLLRAVAADSVLPESHYHLARYYHHLNNHQEERITLETAIQAFDAAPEGSLRRITRRIDAQKRYADILIRNREFFPAEEQLVKGIGIYEDALSRRLLSRSPEFGMLYAGLGDLEYFTKTGNMDMALQYYRRSEQHGWAPPELRYRMGSAYYHLEAWRDALEQFFAASAELPLNRRLLYALGNASCQRGDYFAAQGYYNRLLDILEAERSRLPLLLPNDQPEFIELAERLMIARNNMGAAYEALAEQTGDNRYRTRALALYSESARAWDSLTRNPQTMVRSLPMPGIYGPGVNLPYLNSRNTLYPQPGYEPQIFLQIDKDVLEPSAWEGLAPPGSRLSE
jgi:tetratricopeptide (TPR) repeat protein